MPDSPSKFDQERFASEAKQAICDGVFLDWLFENQIDRAENHYQQFCECLVELHNTGEVDLLKPINQIENNDSSRYDFWLIQNLYCSLIPELECHTDPLIEVVLHLVDQGGDDLAANFPNGAFRDWLKRRPDDAKCLLQQAQQSAEPKFRVLTFVLEAGATHDLAEYHAAAIGFLEHKHLEYRLAAVTALARMDMNTDETRQLKSLVCLCEHADTSESDQELAQTIGALLDVYARRPGMEEGRVIATIESSSKRPTPELHYSLAQSLGRNHENFSYDLQTTIIDALKLANPSLKGVVDQIDFAFSRCLNQQNRHAIASCLHELLDHAENPLDLADLDSFIGQLVTKRSEELHWLVIHWLRFGSHRARHSLPVLFRRFKENGYKPAFTIEEFGFSDAELLFVSHKAIGYLLMESTTTASIIVSCLRASSSKATAEELSILLFDPLMINFSGEAREVVERESKAKGKKRRYLKDAISAHDDYLEGLKSVGRIPELWPSPSERQIQTDRQRQMFARSFKEAEKQSVFANLVTRQTLLHGEGSVWYVRSPQGELHRSESLMSSHGTSIEVPRFDVIDPVYLQHLLLRFRNEKFDT